MKLKRNDTIPTTSGIDDSASVGIRKITTVYFR
jgi:hypothetical protein